MKTLLSLFFAALFLVASAYAQDENVENLKVHDDATEHTDSTTISDLSKTDADSDSIQMILDENFAKEKIDTTTIRFGKKRIVVIEKEGSTSIEIPETNSKYSVSEDDDFTYVRRPRFKGHWAGFEWGFNGFMTPDYSINMTDELKYLELRQGRSWNINLNFLQYCLGFGTDKVGLVTGLGLEFNDYHFRNPITLKLVDGVTVEDDSYELDPDKNVTKSKLSTSYITVPLLLEFQIPTFDYKHRIFLSAGVIGGAKIGSHSKIVFDGANKGRDRVKNDFNISPFRYGLTARIGYRGLNFFANYYPTPMFEAGKGPEIYPFSIGLIIIDFS
ncbi:MAG TPA: PorT family protein [Bacteroidetes bacterium]|nr:PorT family protein [Bacteroidota bacterium]